MFNFLHTLWRRTPRPSCDNCAFVEFLRSNGDGQMSRLHAFCRCPDGPYRDRPVPAARRCDRWQRADRPPTIPRVGDPTLTA
jgi:hypothetical protein